MRERQTEEEGALLQFTHRVAKETDTGLRRTEIFWRIIVDNERTADAEEVLIIRIGEPPVRSVLRQTATPQKHG